MPKLRIALGGLILALWGLGLPPMAQADKTVNVYVGESATFATDYQFSKLAVGDPKVADYAVQRNTATGAEILINGKGPGSTNLILWDAQGNEREQVVINALVRDIRELMRQVQALIGPVEGVRYRVAGGKLIIEGQVTTPQDLARIHKVVGESNQVLTMVAISPASLRIIADTIQASLGHPAIRVRPVGQRIALEGVVHSDETRQLAETQAKLYYDQVANLLEVRKSSLAPGPGDMIQVTTHFMEISNSLINGWGINWFPLAAAGDNKVSGTQDIGGGGGFVGSIVGTISNLFPKLSISKEDGGARILESSSMSVRSGDKAYFHSGGELGIPVSQSSGAVTLTFKRFGIVMEVTPISQGENLSLNLDIEVSSPTTSTGGYVNFKKSQVATVQYCKSADSVAIGGLISARDTKTFDAVPSGVSDALIQLYASEDFRRQRSQFVVFVTPAVLRGAREAHRDLKGVVEDSFGSYQEKARSPQAAEFFK